jgi:hypothetical protein
MHLTWLIGGRAKMRKHTNSTPKPKGPIVKLPRGVRRLWRAQQELAKAYSHTRLKFTLDGRLVGDIAEALALERFSLKEPRRRIKGVDARTRTGIKRASEGDRQTRLRPCFHTRAGTCGVSFFS